MIRLLLAAAVVVTPPVGANTSSEAVASMNFGAPPCGTPEATKAEKCVRWTLVDCDKELIWWAKQQRSFILMSPPMIPGCEPLVNGYVVETKK